MSELAQKLFSDGYVVIAGLLGAEGQEEVDRVRELIELEILSAPEIAEGVEHVSNLQGGSFKALSTNASFHTGSVRALRLLLANNLQDFFLSFLEIIKKKNVEILFDRYRSQPKGTSVGSQAHHRDESTAALLEDVILGGWFNVSAQGVSQYFSCLQGTQLAVNKKGGHAKLKPTKAQLQKAIKVEVPPGSLILFYQNIIHQVHRVNRLPAESTRLHFGVRFTDSEEPLFDHTQVFNNYQAPFLPSGQRCVLFPRLYWVNHFHLLLKMVPYFQEELHVQRKRKAQDVTVIPDSITLTPAMREQYIPYGDEERAYYRPRKLQK